MSDYLFEQITQYFPRVERVPYKYAYFFKKDIT